MSVKTFAVFLAVLAVVGLLAYGVLTKGEKQLEVGDAVPAPELEALVEDPGADPPSNSLAEYRGQWVLLNVWASWCIPCEDEAPDLVRFQREHGGKGFTILGVNTRDATGDAIGFVRDYGLNYPSVRDGDGAYADDLGTTGVPESILVDPDGNVAYARPGQIDAEILDAEVLTRIEAQGGEDT